MTLVEQIAEMRGRGLSYPAIASALGVSQTTVYRNVNPDYAQRSRELSNAAKERNRGECQVCGGPTNACLGPGKASAVCKSCAPAFYAPRQRATKIGRGPTISAVLVFLEDEHTFTEIARHFGWPTEGTSARLNRWVRQGQIVRVARGRYRRAERVAA